MRACLPARARTRVLTHRVLGHRLAVAAHVAGGVVGCAVPLQPNQHERTALLNRASHAYTHNSNTCAALTLNCKNVFLHRPLNPSLRLRSADLHRHWSRAREHTHTHPAFQAQSPSVRPQGSTSLWPETACLQDDTISVLNLMFYSFTGHLVRAIFELTSGVSFSTQRASNSKHNGCGEGGGEHSGKHLRRERLHFQQPC